MVSPNNKTITIYWSIIDQQRSRNEIQKICEILRSQSNLHLCQELKALQHKDKKQKTKTL